MFLKDKVLPLIGTVLQTSQLEPIKLRVLVCLTDFVPILDKRAVELGVLPILEASVPVDRTPNLMVMQPLPSFCFKRDLKFFLFLQM